MTKNLIDDPKYCSGLYSAQLKKLKCLDLYSRLYFWKWEKDVLLILLERAKPKVKRKDLRKKINSDLKKMSDKAWEILEKEGDNYVSNRMEN